MASETCEQLIARGGWAEDAMLKRCSFPIGPRNTWSNIAYAIGGLTVGAVVGTWTAWAFALAMCALGLGSGLYHGFKTLWANRLDWFGMYAVFTALVVHGIVPNGMWPAVLMVLAAGGVAAYFAETLNDYQLNGQIGLLLALSGIPAVVYGSLPMAFVSFGLFLVAYGIWQLDVHKQPIVGLWGHAIWHGLTALAFVAMFLAQSR